MHVYKQLVPGVKVTDAVPEGLKGSDVKLSAYGGSPIKHYGVSSVKCNHKGRSVILSFHVTETEGPTMLGLRSCLELGLVKLNCDSIQNSPIPLGSIRGDAKTDLYKKYPDCFEGIGSFPGEHHIELRLDAEPMIHPPRRIPESLREPLRKELQRMTELGVIQKVDTPTDWVNSLVYITKPNGDLRICLGPGDLNKAISREHHYIPTLDDILPRLKDAKVFSILDARSGYWNVKLDRESQLLTTFNTPYGRYCFLRLPFGIMSAQDVFQWQVDQTYENLPGVVGISDDIVVFGKDDKEHDQCLINMMECTHERGSPGLNLDKCVIKQCQIKFYYITHKGLEPDPQKISAITNMDAP